MTNKLVVTTLEAMVAAGVKHNTTQVNFAGLEKCYETATADMKDGGESDELFNNAWLGLPKGTCANIVGARTKDVV